MCAALPTQVKKMEKVLSEFWRDVPDLTLREGAVLSCRAEGPEHFEPGIGFVGALLPGMCSCVPSLNSSRLPMTRYIEVAPLSLEAPNPGPGNQTSKLAASGGENFQQSAVEPLTQSLLEPRREGTRRARRLVGVPNPKLGT